MICEPDEEVECYSGPSETKDVGICKAGTKICSSDGMNWSECQGEVLPETEICDSEFDEDCDGYAMNSTTVGDFDDDSWTVCSGDCCFTDDATDPMVDSLDSQGFYVFPCQNPELVNPGAVQIDGDGVDNNCSGDQDERTGCSTGNKFETDPENMAMELLKAMDICEIHDPSVGNWGIVGEPVLTLADGSGTPDYRQYGVSTQFGNELNNPVFGENFAILSSGRARDETDPDPTEEESYQITDSNEGNPPADFVTPHGGVLPKTSENCPGGQENANDSVMLTAQIKVPTNAFAFSFDFRFFSQEYYRWTCEDFNDFFVALLDTSWTPGIDEDPIPADKNIAFDKNGNYISVNSGQFFTTCYPKEDYACPGGTDALEETGYKDLASTTHRPCIEETGGICTKWGPNAGATDWLTTTAPVVPGETITLRFAVWDTQDRMLDSLVLLDNFRWHAEPSGGPQTYACWDLNKNGICDLPEEDINGDGVCNERDC